MPKIGRQIRSVHHPLEVIERAKAAGVSRIAVAVSTGKDAAATLHLCCRHFGPQNIRAYFYFYVPGISFQEKYLGYLECLNGIAPILRLPDPALSAYYRDGFFRHRTLAANQLVLCRQRDLDAYIREKFADFFDGHTPWIATGEKCCDSLERNAEWRPIGGLSHKRRRFCPLAFWSNAAVFAYLKQNRIHIGPDYGFFRRSFNPLEVGSLAAVRDNYPDDWRLILRHFPQLQVQLERFERGERLSTTSAAASAAEPLAAG